MDQPPYRQLADDLAARIRSGQFPPGSKLPSLNDLVNYGQAETRGVARLALDYLVEQGWARVEDRRGWFVVAMPPEPPAGPTDWLAWKAEVDADRAELRAEIERLRGARD